MKEDNEENGFLHTEPSALNVCVWKSMNHSSPLTLAIHKECGALGCTISSGALAGILSSVVVVLLLTVLLVSGCLLRWHKRKKSNQLNLP